MTWKRALLIAGAALLLWLRPWRRLLGRPTTGSAGPEQMAAPMPAAKQNPYPEVLPVEPLSAVSGEPAAVEAAAVPPEEAFGAPPDDEPPVEELELAAPVAELTPAVSAADDLAPEAAFPAVAPAPAELDAAPDLGAQPEPVTAEELDAAPDLGEQPEPIAAEELDAALNLIEEVEPGTAAEAAPTGAGAEGADGELEAGLLALGEPEPVEMAEDDLVAAATPAEAPRAQPDDLLVIEGIGPRVSTIVTAAGISSFAELAAADVERLRAILVDAGVKTVDPSTWPEQARIAAEGRWDELRELQRKIKNGKKGREVA